MPSNAASPSSCSASSNTTPWPTVAPCFHPPRGRPQTVPEARRTQRNAGKVVASRLLLVGDPEPHPQWVGGGGFWVVLSQFDNWVEQAIDHRRGHLGPGACVCIGHGVGGSPGVFGRIGLVFNCSSGAAVLRAQGLAEQPIVHRGGRFVKRNEHTIPLRKVQFLSGGEFLVAYSGFETRGQQGRSQENVPGAMNVSIPAVFPNKPCTLCGRFSRANTKGLQRCCFRTDMRTAWVCAISAGVSVADGWIQPLAGRLHGGLHCAAWMWTGKYHRSVSLESNGHVLVYQRGWAFTVRTVMHVHKLQRIQIHQNFLHRHRGVAHVTLFTAVHARCVTSPSTKPANSTTMRCTAWSHSRAVGCSLRAQCGEHPAVAGNFMAVRWAGQVFRPMRERGRSDR